MRRKIVGFTLIELLEVIAMIAILASLLQTLSELIAPDRSQRHYRLRVVTQ